MTMKLVHSETDRTFNATLTNGVSCTDFGHHCENPDLVIVNTGFMYYFQCYRCGWKFPEVGILVPSRFESLQQFHINSITNGTESAIILDREEYLNDAYRQYPNEDLNIAFKKTFTGGHAELGKFLALLYQNKLVSSGAKSKPMWYYFNGNRWEVHSSDIIISKIISSDKIQDLYRRAIKIYSENKYSHTESYLKKLLDYIQKKLDNLSNDSEISKFIRQCNVYMEKDYKVLKAKLDQHKGLICFTNGIYDLDNNIFRSPQADDYITLSTCYDYITNTDTTPEYVELIEFLKKIIPIPDVLHYVLKFLASAISGYTPDEYLHIFIGEGANGKSTLIRLMEATLGELATTLKTTFLTQKNPPADTPSPSIAKTVNKRFVSLQEVNKNENLNESLVKQMTGNDKLDFRQLYKESEDFRPQFKLVMCTNHPVKIHGTDRGIWRRIRMVPFVSTFSETPVKDEEGDFIYVADKSVIEKIDTIWRPVFMCVLIKYYYMWKEEGLKHVPHDISKYTDNYRTGTDIFSEFISEKCVTKKKTDTDFKSIGSFRKDLYEAFEKWKETLPEFKNAGIKYSEFNNKMSSLFGCGDQTMDKITLNSKRDHGWYGIILKKDPASCLIAE
ncbi:hypothetical protein HK096_003915 [Nowakowskiella sp. JEL0078]|nr:hypothetical protein HK096_003915 [Nowakowskiella sp. JEL0078]